VKKSPSRQIGKQISARFTPSSGIRDNK
jgi:hypothetical protein